MREKEVNVLLIAKEYYERYMDQKYSIVMRWDNHLSVLTFLGLLYV